VTDTYRILVAGLGKSGTTALYFKIKNSMPEGVLGYFEPREFRVFDDVQGTSQPLIAKVLTPLPETLRPHLQDFFSHRVLIVRDPRDVLVSSLLYNTAYTYLWRYPTDRIVEALQLLRRKERCSGEVSMLDLFSRLRDDFEINAFAAFCTRMLGAAAALAEPEYRFFTLTYEEMIGGRLQSLADYLGFPLEGSDEVDEALRRVVRTKSSGNWRDWFLSSDVEHFRPLLQPFLRHFRYDTDDWMLNEHPVIPTRDCSGYALRVLNERRADEGLTAVSYDSGPC
jgi:hypothetical protein